jgi:hypothetical protein
MNRALRVTQHRAAKKRRSSSHHEGNAMPLTREQATARLLAALVKDKVDQWTADTDWLDELAREGFVGFDNMQLFDLVRCAHDAGLAGRPDLAECLAMLG